VKGSVASPSELENNPVFVLLGKSCERQRMMPANTISAILGLTGVARGVGGIISPIGWAMLFRRK
jgi:hypothetical protein